MVVTTVFIVSVCVVVSTCVVTVFVWVGSPGAVLTVRLWAVSLVRLLLRLVWSVLAGMRVFVFSVWCLVLLRSCLVLLLLTLVIRCVLFRYVRLTLRLVSCTSTVAFLRRVWGLWMLLSFALRPPLLRTLLMGVLCSCSALTVRRRILRLLGLITVCEVRAGRVTFVLVPAG